jgi:hypothetical protein
VFKGRQVFRVRWEIWGPQACQVRPVYRARQASKGTKEILARWELWEIRVFKVRKEFRVRKVIKVFKVRLVLVSPAPRAMVRQVYKVRREPQVSKV